VIPHFGLQRQYKQLKEELLDATDKVLSSGTYLDGKYTNNFEDWLCKKTQSNYAVTVHSGTQALEIIADFVKINSRIYGYENPTVILPNISYPATLNAFLQKDLDVNLFDTDKYGILSDDVPNLNFYCLVGLYGRKPWADIEFLDSPNVIVDGAQHWLVADGNIGLGMSISFDPTKNLPSSGNGGAIVTNDLDLYNFALRYRNNGKPNFDFVGSNTKLSEHDCAHLLVRANYIDFYQYRREEIRKYYCSQLRDYVSCLSDSDIPHANQKFVLYSPEHRNDLHSHLMASGIESKIHYDYTLGELKTAETIKFKPNMMSISCMLTRGVLSLPIYPELTDGEVEFIAKSVKDFFTLHK
jgi:dTDP-4-amino-4,6-dideoxygalactose transaminase